MEKHVVTDSALWQWVAAMTTVLSTFIAWQWRRVVTRVDVHDREHATRVELTRSVESLSHDMRSRDKRIHDRLDQIMDHLLERKK